MLGVTLISHECMIITYFFYYDTTDATDTIMVFTTPISKGQVSWMKISPGVFFPRCFVFFRQVLCFFCAIEATTCFLRVLWWALWCCFVVRASWFFETCRWIHSVHHHFFLANKGRSSSCETNPFTGVVFRPFCCPQEPTLLAHQQPLASGKGEKLGGDVDISSALTKP